MYKRVVVVICLACWVLVSEPARNVAGFGIRLRAAAAPTRRVDVHATPMPQPNYSERLRLW